MTSEPIIIDAGHQCALKPWLDRTLEAAEIVPHFHGGPVPLYWTIEVTNGLTGEDRESALIAFCQDQDHAELVAAALWAMVL